MNWRGWVLMGLAGVLAALAGLGLWRLVQRAPNQILTLPNGMEYRFAGVTYGTNHVMQPRWAGVIQKLPGPIESLARKILGNTSRPMLSTRRTPEPSLAVWFEPLGTNAGGGTFSTYMQAMLVDETGVASGEKEDISVWSGATSPQWFSEVFEEWPRRSRILECVLFQYSYGQAESYTELGRFQFRKPAFGEFPQWKPESLPTTKPAGDINITLHEFLSGSESGGRWKNGHIVDCRAAKPGEEPGATVRFTVDSPRGTNESWAVAQFYLSDATGNHRKASSWSGSVGDPAHFSPVLWPDEDAWKLTAQFKRRTGFPENDLAVFQDVPLPRVGETNNVLITNVVNDIECVLESIVLRAPMTNRSYCSRDLSSIRLAHADLPDDFAVDLISVTFDDSTTKVESNGSSYSYSAGEYKVQFTEFPTNQTRATITYAVQKTREVEFMVSPNWVDSANNAEMKIGEN